jgi:ABC-type glutathione transport system ATPase component
MIQKPAALLTISSLTLQFGGKKLLDNVSLSVKAGESLGILGESGAGKSLLARAILQLPGNNLQVSGNVLWQGQPINDQIDALRGRSIAYIPQSPLEASFPVTSLASQWKDQCKAVGISFDPEEAMALLQQAGIDDPARALRSLPHQLSGGQLQRVLIAMAMMAKPQLLIADEPTTALDTINQAAILHLLKDFCRKERISLMLITHDISIIQPMCDAVAILKKGVLIESGAVADVLAQPKEAYTASLIQAHTRLMTAKTRVKNSSTVANPILSVKNLAFSYQPPGFFWEFGKKPVQALRSVSFDVYQGQISGLAGASGSGKTTLMRAIAGIYPGCFGNLSFDGKTLSAMSPTELRLFRKAVQVIYQTPASAFDPRYNVGQILQEAVAANENETKTPVKDLLDWVKLPTDLLQSFPWQLSGGEKQRLAIARSLALHPRVLLCDEPTSSLDQSIQAEILDLFLYLKKEFNLGILLVSHNLAALRHTCDHLTVLADGEVKEAGDIENVLANPTSDYTQQLIDAEPALTHNFL